ncbi:hypothetical protein GCM10009759_67480 [Kitasatospora saccharophila]|uniref:DUF317 domain-containing protein n=1 Tax=Kitasatospora saccharophila TaxID=407973 RepID=A0ABP5JS20_9ACTN
MLLLESSPWNRDEYRHDGLGGTWGSPDLHGTVHFDRRDCDVQWSITVNASSDAGWKATFGHYVPSSVVRAALEATVSDRAVERRADSLPAAHLTHLTTPTAAGLPTDRIPAALSYSRPVRLNPRPASQPSPAAPAPAAGGRRR